MKIEFVNRQTKRIPRQRLRVWIQKVAKELKNRRISIRGELLRLVFLNERDASKLNRRFRKKRYATDILSFAPVEENELGELVICMPVIERQATEHGLSVARELEYMILHGILHLLGFDHEKSDKAARRMYRLQDTIFDKLT